MSKQVTLQAEFDSIEQAEQAARSIRTDCRTVGSIRFYRPRQARREPPAMSALFINYGFSQVDPKGVDYNDPAYPPHLFYSRWEDSCSTESDLYSKDRCRMAVTLGEEERHTAEALLINRGGRKRSLG